MPGIIKVTVLLILIVLISILPSLSNVNKFKIKLAVSGLVNKIIIFTIIGLSVLEDKMIGLLLLVLIFSALNLNISNRNQVEGFTNYYKS